MLKFSHEKIHTWQKIKMMMKKIVLFKCMFSYVEHKPRVPLEIDDKLLPSSWLDSNILNSVYYIP